VARLRRVAARLGEGEDENWFRAGAAMYLDAYAEIGLEDALGLSAVAGGKHWRTGARRAERDDAIRALAGYFPGLRRSPCAGEIAQMLTRYAASRWLVDRARAVMPETYLGTPRAHMWAVLVAGGGKVPGVSRIRQLLSTCSPVFIGSEFGDTCGHDTDRTDDRRDERC
jgi:hypothetical protein